MGHQLWLFSALLPEFSSSSAARDEGKGPVGVCEERHPQSQIHHVALTPHLTQELASLTVRQALIPASPVTSPDKAWPRDWFQKV